MAPKQQPTASLEAKLEAALAKLDTLDEIKATLEETNSLLQDHVARVANLEVNVAAVQECQAATSNHLAIHDREIAALKSVSNSNQQLLKMTTIRIIGYPISAAETAASLPTTYLRDTVFNRLLLPILTAAASAKFLSSVPPPADTITRIFRAGRATAGSPPPPIIVVLSSLTIRQAIFYYKAKNLPSPNPSERTDGGKKFLIVEDLTRDVHRLLKSMQGDERIARAWTVEGQIRFTRVNEDKVNRVTNIYLPFEEIVGGHR